MVQEKLLKTTLLGFQVALDFPKDRVFGWEYAGQVCPGEISLPKVCQLPRIIIIRRYKNKQTNKQRAIVKSSRHSCKRHNILSTCYFSTISSLNLRHQFDIPYSCALIVRSFQKCWSCNICIFFFVFSYLMNTEVEKLNLRAFDGHQDVKTYM